MSISLVVIVALVRIVTLVPAVNVAWGNPREFTMLIDKRHTIGPHTVLFKIPRDMNLLASVPDVFSQQVLGVCVSSFELLLDSDQLVLHLLEVMVGSVTTQLDVLEVVQCVDRVVKKAHDGYFVGDMVL